jgi:hypothetical protein
MAELKATFKQILDKSFDYKEALQRVNVSQSDVNILREKLLGIKEVPKAIYDKQVSI